MTSPVGTTPWQTICWRKNWKLERAVELESELEQDERPIDYDAELEDAEEEAAPHQREAAENGSCGPRRCAGWRMPPGQRRDFAVVVEEWNKLDRNRERRERDHENLRGDVPLGISGRAGTEDRAHAG